MLQQATMPIAAFFVSHYLTTEVVSEYLVTEEHGISFAQPLIAVGSYLV